MMTFTRDALKGLAPILCFFGAVCLLVYTLESCERKRETRYEQQAHEAKGRADVHVEASAKAEGVANQAHERAEAAEAEVKRIRAALAQPKVGTPAPAAVPGALVPMSAPREVDDLSPLVAAQDKQIAALKDENAALRAALEESKAAFAAERDRANNLWLALEAQKAASKGALWKGRIQGLAVGFAAGYVGGRLK